MIQTKTIHSSDSHCYNSDDRYSNRNRNTFSEGTICVLFMPVLLALCIQNIGIDSKAFAELPVPTLKSKTVVSTNNNDNSILLYIR